MTGQTAEGGVSKDGPLREAPLVSSP
jgi:hypothetical protein